MSVLGDRIRLMRKQKNITQEDLGAIFGYGKSTVSQWETGVNTPDVETVAKIAKFLDCTTDYLLGLSAQRHPPSTMPEVERRKREIKHALLSLVSHDDGEFPIEDGLVDTVFEHMEKAKEFHAKRKGDQKK